MGGTSGVVCLNSGENQDLTSCKGDSGGPWFTRDSNSQVVIVGVMSYSYVFRRNKPITVCNPWEGTQCGGRDQESVMAPLSDAYDYVQKDAHGFQWTKINDRKKCW